MTIEMANYQSKLAKQGYRALNGKADPFDLLSNVDRNVGDVHEMMQSAGLFGWNPELIPMSGMDSKGNIYTAPKNTLGIVVPEFPGGPAFFGTAGESWKFIKPEAVEDLLYTIAAHGTPMTGVQPGVTTRFFFDHEIMDLAGARAEGRRAVAAGETGAHEVGGRFDMPIKVRWTVSLGNTGNKSLRISQHVTSMICANGLTTDAIMGATSISHSSLAGAKLDAFVEDFNRRSGLGLASWIADAKKTMANRMSLVEAEALWAELFEWEDDKKGASLTMQNNQEERLHELWVSPTQQAHGAGTAWAFFNTVTEYLDHEAIVRTGTGTRREALARRVVEGSSTTEALKNRAWEMALAAV